MGIEKLKSRTMPSVRYKDWVSNEENRWDTATISPVKRLLATLDDTDAPVEEGDPLPVLWHWLYFLPEVSQSLLRSDGHAKRGEFFPPVELPQRMFAGGSVTLHTSVPIGTRMHRKGAVVDIAEKTGRTGKLVFVTVRYCIFCGQQLCIDEEQKIVYMERGLHDIAPDRHGALEDPPRGAWVRTIVPDSVLLFRFSALTFNAHRIHYDRSYAVNKAGYPGLIVHGPLIAILLADLVRQHAGRAVRHFVFHATAPIFENMPFLVWGIQKNQNQIELKARRADRLTAMKATAQLEI